MHVDKKAVFDLLSCNERSKNYSEISDIFDEISDEVFALIAPFYMIHKCSRGFLVISTIGQDISHYISNAFSRGKYLEGTLANAIADIALLSLEQDYIQEIRRKCSHYRIGIAKRLEAGTDFQLAQIQTEIEHAGMELTEGGMMKPLKSLAVIFETTEDEKMFCVEHDCKKCAQKKCGYRRYGIAIDLGTTTIAAQMLNLNTKQMGTVCVCENEQKRYGRDVISRMNASMNGNKQQLQQIVQNNIKALIQNLIEQENVDWINIKEIVLAGNTAMIHMLMSYDCSTLGVYPYTPYSLKMIQGKACDILNIKELAAPITIIPGITSYVGGDILAGLFQCDFQKKEKSSLFVDLGTNGELAIGNKEIIMVASTAAGPAFEGGNISCGMASIAGAISHVAIRNNEIQVETIGHKKPRGICGTGIVDAIAEAIEMGLLEESGKMHGSFILAQREKDTVLELTQKDIREFQLAKAAIRAGIETLCMRYGISKEEISSIYLAGGFGCEINVENAIKVGLFPEEFRGKIISVGNSSLGGALKYMLDENGNKSIEKILEKAEELLLAEDYFFSDMFVQHIGFE